MIINYKEIQIIEMNTVYIEKINEDGCISVIPVDVNNSDYQLYLKWLEENNV